MPIPDLKGDLTREEVIKKYAEEPYVWSKKISFDWIEVDQRRGAYLKKTFEVNADAMPCAVSDDAAYQLSFVKFVPTGIVWTCANCRRTEGPLAFNASGIRLVKQSEVTLGEAWDTIKKTNQKAPLGLPALSGKEGFRVK